MRTSPNLTAPLTLNKIAITRFFRLNKAHFLLGTHIDIEIATTTIKT